MAEHGLRKWIITITVIVASLLELIDTTIVNVALPDIMGNLGATLDDAGWIVTGYAVANVIVLPMSGWLGDKFGRKSYFITSILIFTGASFLCGHAHSLSELVAFRLLQGLAGGGLLSTAQAILIETWPREEIGMATALFGMGAVVGPTVGPTIGGYIVKHFAWPWIFYVNIPVGIMAAVMIAGYVHDPAHQKRPRAIDYLGIALLIVSVGSLQYVLEHGEREDWFASHFIAWLTVTGVVGGVLLVWRELKTEHPVIDFRVLKHRQMWVGTLLGVVMGIGLYAMSFTLPVFMQGNLAMTAEQTGWILMPGALATAVSMGVVGRVTNKFDPRLLITAGALTFALAAWKLSLITGASGAGDFFWPLILRGVGLGLMFVPLTTITLAELSPTELAQGTGLYNFFRQLGGSFGIAAISTLLIRYTAQNRANLVSHVSTLNPVSMARIEMMTRGLMAKGADFWTAQKQALALIDHQLMAQASVLAYAKIYELSAALILLLIPLLLLVRKTRGAAGAHAILE